MKKSKVNKEYTKRILSMLEIAGVSDLNSEDIVRTLEQSGVEKAILKYNIKYNVNLSMGEYIIYSDAQKAYWSNDFGWSDNKDAASGYTEQDLEFYKNKDGDYEPKFYDVSDAKFIKY